MKRYTLILALACSSFLFYSCNDDTVSTQPLFTYSISHTDCKSTIMEDTSGLDCLEYEYDGSNVLTIHHINAGFNCCPDDFDAVISMSGNSIIIDETRIEGNCDCNCLFDMTYTIKGVKPGKYTISFSEPLVYSKDSVLVYTADLAKEPNGSLCVVRDHYPWGI